jgi:hypothetical protein
MKILKTSLALVLSTSLAVPSVAFAATGPDPATMSDEERMQQAKTLYGEAEASFSEGDFAGALAKYEEAYNVYAPSLHVFNINIGMAAYETGDCVKAKTALQRFLDLVPDHPGRTSAQEKLLEIERSGCANVQPVAEEPAPITAPTTAPVTEDSDDAPILTSRKDEREEEAARERKARDDKKASPMLIAGAVLTAVGGAAIIGGAVSLGLANAKANKLADLASPGPTGFPDGNYADDEVFNLDRNQLPANNNATIALFVGGGVLAVVGVSLIAVDITRKKKGGSRPGDKNALKKQQRRMVVGPAFLPGGGGATMSARF